MRGRLTSRHLVGRASELAELEAAAADAAAGRPALALIAGDSGVGKTRLVQEAERRLDERGTQVLRGECMEQSDGELPYAPLIGAFRSLLRHGNPVLGGLSPGSAAALASLFPNLEPSAGRSTRDDGAGQLRVFEALREVLDVLEADAPVALVLEDLHWADRSTRSFVSYLARSMRGERLLLALTYRSDELHRRHPLRPLLAELVRLERVRRIELEPFDRAELIEALHDILEGTPDPDLVGRLYMRAEGNPLYTEELLAAGLDGRGPAPQNLRDAFMLRIERLDPAGRRVAQAIAVARRLDEAGIAAVTGLRAEELHAALRDAVAELVVVEHADGLFAFRHALLREVVYDDLLPGERGELHLALARAFEATAEQEGGARDAQLAATIAHHYTQAGDQPAALRASVQAALAACEVHAYGEAAELAERALELWPRVPDAAELLPLDHVELLRVAAHAYGLAGDRTRAEVLVRTALGELDAGADPRRHAMLLARLARIQWSLNRGAEGVETAQRALAMLPSDEPSRERASLLAWLARTRHLRGRYRDALREGEAALEAAIEAGARDSQTEVLNTIGMSQIVLGQVEPGAARLRDAIELARADDDLESLSTAYGNLADALNLAGRTAEALAIAREGLAATPPRMTRTYDWMSLTISELSLELGEWDAAHAALVPVDRLSGLLLIFGQLRRAELALAVGETDTAQEALAAIADAVMQTSEPQWIGTHGVLLAELRRRRLDLDGARAAAEHALDRIELCTDDVARIARVAAAGARVEADRAQRARDLGDRAQERDALARARLHEARLRAAAQEGGPVERAWLATGHAELARARGRSDPSRWAAAAAAWEAIERPYLVAVAWWQAAEALAGRGDRDGAASAAAQALAIARRLGSAWLSEEVSGLALRARLALHAPAPARDAAGAPAARGGGDDARAGAPTAGEDPFGLTPRERQVLALLAEGATNRQIGDALFMAEKTASVHVSRILAKLGVQSRTQAAAVAHRHHLADAAAADTFPDRG